MNISLELLQILDAIEQRGSFAAAAHSLHRVPSAVSQAINKAETQFGFPHELDGRRNVLTAAGKTCSTAGDHCSTVPAIWNNRRDKSPAAGSAVAHRDGFTAAGSRSVQSD